MVIISSFNAIGQLRVGSSDWCDGQRLTDKEYERLKKSTVYFIMPEYLKEDEETFAEIVKENWTYSKIEIIDEKDYSKYENKDKAAFLTMKVHFWNNRYSGLYYEMWQRKVKKDALRNQEDDFYGRFELILDNKLKKRLENADEKKAIKIISEDLKDIRNFTPVLVGSYLKTIDFSLREKVKMCGGSTPKPLIKDDLGKLIEDTLYISNDLINEEDKFEEDDFVKKYIYPYRFITLEELEDMLTANKKFFYYISLGEYVAVNDSKTGELLYWTRNYIPRTKKSEIKDLAKAIKKKSKN